MRRASWLLTIVLSCAVIGASCTDSDIRAAADVAPDVQPAAPTGEASTIAPTGTAPTSLPTTTQDPPAPPPNNDPPDACVVISDFGSEVDRSSWQIVNDDVMGGRSLGERRFVDDTMVFEGSIDTDGGGFSSLRRPIEPGALAGMTTILVRAGSDGRTYMLTVEDALDGRDRRVNHRAVLAFEGDNAVATVAFADLAPAVFGQPITDRPIAPDLVDEIGLMVSDGIDGDFRLEVAWVAACP